MAKVKTKIPKKSRLFQQMCLVNYIRNTRLTSIAKIVQKALPYYRHCEERDPSLSLGTGSAIPMYIQVQRDCRAPAGLAM